MVKGQLGKAQSKGRDIDRWAQGAKLRKYFGFLFGKPPQKIGFAENLSGFPNWNRESILPRAWFLWAFQSEILVEKLAFRQCFWVSGKAGKPVISHPGSCHRQVASFYISTVVWLRLSSLGSHIRTYALDPTGTYDSDVSSESDVRSTVEFKPYRPNSASKKKGQLYNIEFSFL